MRTEAPCGCSARRTISVLGVPIDPLEPPEALARLEGLLACPRAHVVNHLAADPIVLAQRDAGLRQALGRADLNLPDGMGVVWAARALGASIRQRCYGPDFMLAVARWGAARGLRHAFCGGGPESLPRLVARLETEAPGLRVSGAWAPPVRAVDERAVTEDLERLGGEADVLWVGLGTPKQQLWAHLARPQAPARIIVTVGAAFDFLAGTKPQAPRWVQRAGLEWAFRLACEPRRLWRRYLLGNPRFAALVVAEAVRAARGRR